MTVYYCKCNQCGKEYFNKIDFLFEEEFPECPNCGSVDFETFDYNPLNNYRTDREILLSSCG